MQKYVINYYELLGISQDATAEEIKSAYRKCVRKYHPDVAGNTPDVVAKFKEISTAYETLSDETARKRYDILRGIYNFTKQENTTSQKTEKEKTPTPEKPQTQPPPPKDEKKKTQSNGHKQQGFTNILNDIIDGIKQYQKENPKPINGEDITTDITITVAEAISGTNKTVNILTTQVCPKCFGRKFVNTAQCPICQGKGVQSVHKKITVKIPEHIKDNSKIRIANEGNQGVNGGKNGDLYLNVSIENNSGFEYDDLNILLTIPITPPEAVLGTTINIPTPDGAVSMRIMPKTNSGQKYRLSGLGLKKGEKVGDIIVTVNIEIPKTISQQEIELYKQIQDLTKEKVV